MSSQERTNDESCVSHCFVRLYHVHYDLPRDCCLLSFQRSYSLLSFIYVCVDDILCTPWLEHHMTCELPSTQLHLALEREAFLVTSSRATIHVAVYGCSIIIPADGSTRFD